MLYASSSSTHPTHGSLCPGKCRNKTPSLISFSARNRNWRANISINSNSTDETLWPSFSERSPILLADRAPDSQDWDGED